MTDPHPSSTVFAGRTAEATRRPRRKRPPLLPSHFRQRLLWPLQALGVWLVGCIALLPVEWASWLGAGVFRLIGPRMESSKKIAWNFRRIFPHSSPAEIDRLVRATWATLGRVVAEFPHLPRFVGRAWAERVEVVGADHATASLQEGRPRIFFTAHVGNWEFAALTLVRLGLPLTVVYAAMKNPIIDRILRRYRLSLGCSLAERGRAGSRSLVEAIKNGRSLGLVVDRKRRDGTLVPFFGRDAWTTTAPARLALKYNCPLVPIRVVRLKGARFRVTIHPPLQVPSGSLEHQEMELTRQMNAAVESWITEQPDQWWCDTRRWPKKP